MTRLEKWLEEEVALIVAHDPSAPPERIAEYREALTKTLRGEQLKLADDVEAFARVAFHPDPEGLAGRVLAQVTAVSDRVRDEGLRRFFHS